MKILLTTANLGNFEKTVENVEQSMDYDFYRFTDQNFPPRYCSMTSRLQARIPKLFSWQLKPGYDYYVWVDSSCILAKDNSLKWLVDKCVGKDMVVFKHPNRSSIQAEADYLKKRLAMGCPYITPRYDNELIDEQLAVIKDDKDYVDNCLFASTAMVYRNNKKMQDMMKEWFFHISRYHSIDQLSLPYVIWKHKLDIDVIQESYLKTPYLQYIRK